MPTPPPLRENGRERSDLWGLPPSQQWVYLLVLAVLVASVLLPREWVEEGPVVCGFRSLSGLPCPGCGLTRSFVATGHLAWTDAFDRHLFGPVLFAVLVVVLAARAASSWFGWQRVLLPSGPLGSRVVRWLLVAWILWAALRLGLACAG